ncbi:carbon-nitrogen hydrolase family protein [Enemella evansiae]|uniref:carbon-nitrogen hydrolase family protein n=1 Tax=Enemella evansiae TaxID=2016499 RepID=UPI0010617BF5|nr:carbon-nitrogen hydrolase family protein [Enemella evansiae]TDO93019.1 nitrilase [Enemella evansiae]
MSKVAVVQASSVPFDTPATVAKAIRLIRECADQGAELAVFPEAFIGGYPKGADFGAVVGSRTPQGRKAYRRYVEAAVTLDDPLMAELGEAVREAGITVVTGVIERLGNTLYCTAVTFAADGSIAGHHRKLMPTGSERLVWGFGDGSTIGIVDTPVGRLGSVICWENYMPMLRQAMYAQGTEIYCAPTADDRPTWISSMIHIALEGRVHVLTACQAIRWDEFPDDYEREQRDRDTWAMRGGSAIIAPSGEVLAGPVFDEETILCADIDPGAKTDGHLDFDPAGHYARPDVFRLQVDTGAKNAVTLDPGTGH